MNIERDNFLKFGQCCTDEECLEKSLPTFKEYPLEIKLRQLRGRIRKFDNPWTGYPTLKNRFHTYKYYLKRDKEKYLDRLISTFDWVRYREVKYHISSKDKQKDQNKFLLEIVIIKAKMKQLGQNGFSLKPKTPFLVYVQR